MKLELKHNRYKGKLITFCGLDGCGKTTMIDMLYKYMTYNNIACRVVKQPSVSIRNNLYFRESIDKPYNNDIDYRAVSMLCAADKLQNTSKVIERYLYEGFVVISDRYIYSTLANLMSYGFDNEKWLYEISKYFISPDLAFFLDVNYKTAISRVRKREKEKNRFIDESLQKTLSEKYLKIAEENNGVVINCETSIYKSFDNILTNTRMVIK